MAAEEKTRRIYHRHELLDSLVKPGEVIPSAEIEDAQTGKKTVNYTGSLDICVCGRPTAFLRIQSQVRVFCCVDCQGLQSEETSHDLFIVMRTNGTSHCYFMSYDELFETEIESINETATFDFADMRFYLPDNFELL